MTALIHRMSEEDYNHYLKHHGILGQKWGSKNGPPYPLDPAKDYSSQEKKLNSNNTNLKSTKQLKDDFKDLDYEFDFLKDDYKNDPRYNNLVENENRLKTIIEDKSGNWYDQEGVSDNFKNQINKIDKSSQKLEDYEDKLINDFSKQNPNIAKLQKQINEADEVIKKLRSEKSEFKNIFKKKIIDEEINKEYERSDYLNSLLIDEKWAQYEKFRDFIKTDSKYKKLQDDAKKDEYDILGVVLKDIGYEDTPEAREYIRLVVFWD